MKIRNFPIINLFCQIRERTVKLCAPLEVEDYVVQPVAEVSPPKWHLAHTTWFFENFVLRKAVPDYKGYNKDFNCLFNSYYNSQGEMWKRQHRGALSRPTVSEIVSYRKFVDEKTMTLLTTGGLPREILDVIELGLNHEEQHQELLLMDIKYILSINPCRPRYLSGDIGQTNFTPQLRYISVPGGQCEVGDKTNSFAFDNECPQHQVLLSPFKLANRLVSNYEYMNFISDGGYARSELWLSDGWEWVNRERISSPLYWRRNDSEWFIFSLYGERPINPSEPVSHVSFYEADAFARWSGQRLPTEFELEVVYQNYNTPVSGHFLEKNILKPVFFSEETSEFFGLAGGLWTWTASPYLPYPGYKPFAGDFAEYNGKFMCNQFVLRGGCLATPETHFRSTYRNFFYPQNRWQFSGIRLAEKI